MSIINKDVKIIKSIGEKTQNYLKMDNNIKTCKDLLCYYPSSYNIVSLTTEPIFKNDENLLITGIVNSQLLPLRLKTNLDGIVFDLLINDNCIKVLIPKNNFLRFDLIKGKKVSLFGKYLDEYKMFLCKELFTNNLEEYIIPKYNCINIPSSKLRLFLENLFCILEYLEDDLSKKKTAEYNLVDRYTFYKLLHFPKLSSDLRAVSKRFKYDYYTKLLKNKPQNTNLVNSDEVIKIVRSKKSLFNDYITFDEELKLYEKILDDINID